MKITPANALYALNLISTLLFHNDKDIDLMVVKNPAWTLHKN